MCYFTITNLLPTTLLNHNLTNKLNMMILIFNIKVVSMVCTHVILFCHLTCWWCCLCYLHRDPCPWSLASYWQTLNSHWMQVNSQLHSGCLDRAPTCAVYSPWLSLLQGHSATGTHLTMNLHAQWTASIGCNTRLAALLILPGIYSSVSARTLAKSS